MLHISSVFNPQTCHHFCRRRCSSTVTVHYMSAFLDVALTRSPAVVEMADRTAMDFDRMKYCRLNYKQYDVSFCTHNKSCLTRMSVAIECILCHNYMTLLWGVGVSSLWIGVVGWNNAEKSSRGIGFFQAFLWSGSNPLQQQFWLLTEPCRSVARNVFGGGTCEAQEPKFEAEGEDWGLMSLEERCKCLEPDCKCILDAL